MRSLSVLVVEGVRVVVVTMEVLLTVLLTCSNIPRGGWLVSVRAEGWVYEEDQSVSPCVHLSVLSIASAGDITDKWIHYLFSLPYLLYLPALGIGHNATIPASYNHLDSV